MSTNNTKPEEGITGMDIAEYATYQYFLTYTHNEMADFKSNDELLENVAEKIENYAKSQLSPSSTAPQGEEISRLHRELDACKKLIEENKKSFRHSLRRQRKANSILSAENERLKAEARLDR